MISVTEFWNNQKTKILPQRAAAFGAALIVGLVTHLPVMLSDIPNHDGLFYAYSDQNNAIAGRWFLTVTNAVSSYYSMPWVSGLLGLFFLAVAAALVAELTEIRSICGGAMIGALMATYPALASTLAYGFMFDSYMIAVVLAVSAVLLTKKYRFGWIAGAVCLTFSLGIYQSYLACAVLLSWYAILMTAMGEGTLREKLAASLRYLYMGAAGSALYYVILRIVLKVQDAELLSYQGMDSLSGSISLSGIPGSILKMYRDFVTFSLRAKILAPNALAAAALVMLAAVAVCALGERAVSGGWFRKPMFYVLILLTVVIWPVGTNIVLLITPDVNYHLIMRYSWVLIPVLLIAFADRNLGQWKVSEAAEWCILVFGVVLIFCYNLVDNIGYSNLSKRYEKTYAYCVRLLDRIEQTEGYYPGIPIAMIGVVSDQQYPSTDLTTNVTGSMIGLTGDFLYYRGENYQAFFRYYLGATVNLVEPDAIEEIYYSDEYIAMDSFPGRNSTKVIDGIMYVKTENSIDKE